MSKSFVQLAGTLTEKDINIIHNVPSSPRLAGLGPAYLVIF